MATFKLSQCEKLDEIKLYSGLHNVVKLKINCKSLNGKQKRKDQFMADRIDLLMFILVDMSLIRACQSLKTIKLETKQSYNYLMQTLYLTQILATIRNYPLCVKFRNQIVVEKKRLNSDDISRFWLSKDLKFFRNLFNKIIQAYPFYKRDNMYSSDKIINPVHYNGTSTDVDYVCGSIVRAIENDPHPFFELLITIHVFL